MKTYISLLIIFISVIINAQQKQPKVGLVLSGGGAKGFAHVGILKEIEKAGIQIDYIAGTSMGAIIGGLYAAGYSAVQIEDILLKTDFNILLRDQIPRSTSPFFEKEFGEKTSVTLPVNEGKISFPKAVSKGQNILNLLFKLLNEVSEIDDFSKLPIPFFCIATDVENGGEVLLESGSLPLALRASASFPTLLNPVNLNGKLLIDGGVANNFPVTLIKEKGMDIVIGVDVEGKLVKKEKLNSVISILNQIVSYQMYERSNKEREKLDVYIHPDVYEYTVVDFDDKKKILKRGAEEGKKFSEIFKEIAAKQSNKRPRKTIQNENTKFLISEINIKGIENYTRAYILGKLKIRLGDSISKSEIYERINLLSATKNYDRIDYKVTKNSTEQYSIHFNVKESKDYASLSLGAHYDLLYKSSIIANYKHKNLLKKNDLLSLDLILGDNLRYNFSYFVDNGFYISYGFRSRFNHFRDNAKFNLSTLQQPNVSNISLNYTDISNQLFLQTTFDRRFALGFGLEHKFLRATTETFTVNNEKSVIDNSNYYSLFGYLKLDTYNKKYFATKGYFADLNFNWFLNSSNYNNNFRRFAQAKGTLGFANTFWDKLTFTLTNEAGFTLNNPTSNIFDFYLGGYNQNYINTFVSLYGYNFSELSANSFVKSEFNFRYALNKNNYLSFIANYARLDDNVFKDIDLFKDIYSGYALGYSYNSIIGPIEIKYSWSPDTKQSHWLFNLGFWF